MCIFTAIYVANGSRLKVVALACHKPPEIDKTCLFLCFMLMHSYDMIRPTIQPILKFRRILNMSYKTIGGPKTVHNFNCM